MKYIDLDPVCAMVKREFPECKVQMTEPSSRMWVLVPLSQSTDDPDGFSFNQFWVHTDGSYWTDGKPRTRRDRQLVRAIIDEIDAQLGAAA